MLRSWQAANQGRLNQGARLDKEARTMIKFPLFILVYNITGPMVAIKE